MQYDAKYKGLGFSKLPLVTQALADWYGTVGP